MSYSCITSWRLNKGYSTADKQLPDIIGDKLTKLIKSCFKHYLLIFLPWVGGCCTVWGKLFPGKDAGCCA